MLADPPTPCGIDREGDWERYEVTNASGAKSIRYPATFELSELSSYDQGEIIWLDRNERVTITEMASSTPSCVGMGMISLRAGLM